MLSYNGTLDHTRWDSNTLLPQLDPRYNNVVPNIVFHPQFSQEVVAMVAGQIRVRAEKGLNKSPLHNALYNLLSMNGFNNQDFANAVYYATNLAAYIMFDGRRDRNYSFERALSIVLKGYMGLVLDSNPHLYQITDANITGAVQQNYQIFKDALRDVNSYMTAINNQSQQGYQQPQQPMHNDAYSQAQQPRQVQQPTPVRNVQLNGPRVVTPGAGGYGDNNTTAYAHSAADQLAQQSSQQIKEWGTSNPSNIDVEKVKAMETIPERTDIPKHIDDVVFDPQHYMPDHFSLNLKRPYDVIHIPGGSRLELAHKSRLRITKDNTILYDSCVDPTVFCHYFLIWADGTIQDYFAPWEEGMEYIKHELDTMLRGVNIKPKGEMLTSSRVVINGHEEALTVSQVKAQYGDDITENDVMAHPLFIEQTVITSSHCEDEDTAQRVILDELGWEETVDEIPSHIYMTEQIHPISVSKETEDRLFALRTASSLKGVAEGLKELLKDDLIDLRTFRLINERFTQELNSALRNNMAVDDIILHSFVSDYDELINIFKTEEQFDGFDVLIESKCSRIIESALCLRVVEEEDGEDNLFIVDQQINYRVGFELARLANVTRVNEARLISSYTSPNLAKLSINFIEEAKTKRKLPGKLFIVTSDGVYLEVLAGWLGSKNFLIRRVS